jgi:hypothetical protein
VLALTLTDLGLTVGILRAVTSIPGHTFTGVLMGYQVGLAKFAATGQERNKYLLKGFLIAFSLHALYNTLVLSDTAAAMLMIPLVVFYFVAGIRILKKGSLLSQRLWQSEQYSHAVQIEEKEAAEPVVLETYATNEARCSWIFLRAIVARILLLLSATFWMILLIVIFVDKSGFQEALEIISGGLIISAVPITVGILLEKSYRRKLIARKV